MAGTPTLLKGLLAGGLLGLLLSVAVLYVDAPAVIKALAVLVLIGSGMAAGNAFFSRRHRRERRRGNSAESPLAAIDQMAGAEFESYIADRLRDAGWQVSTAPPNDDDGVDLIAHSGERRLAIQCTILSEAADVRAVQQAVTGAEHHHCDSTMVVSNREFTKAAKELAHDRDCQLVGRARLSAWTK